MIMFFTKCIPLILKHSKISFRNLKFKLKTSQQFSNYIDLKKTGYWLKKFCWPKADSKWIKDENASNYKQKCICNTIVCVYKRSVCRLKRNIYVSLTEKTH